MPRPKRKTVELNSTSLRELLQTIWVDAEEQRNKAIFQYNKWNRDVRENTDIALIGKTNNELLKVIDGAIDKKIQVARLVKDYVANSSAPSDTVTSVGTVSEDTKDAIFEMIQKASAANSTEYVVTNNDEADKEPF